ncbi:hypothetical protein [Streptomyces candidus]|uniref:SH3 domain-containing protein n=1 Tax=Streptomyces candidus TaxID=67283 RepID=A0A7X0HC82_9ACTN|nr:hypothetical protein [Streptomyces candidus]MBB6434958.1 hypothetical protein [Streptomyces candidus]GHH41236.1 hypothetical protein GCM10018773_24120 [Streptomyces candidus]
MSVQLKVAQARLGAVSVGIALALCAPAVALATSPAPAAGTESAQATARHGVAGKVTAKHGQFVRSRPTTHSARIGSYRGHAMVRIACKVRGQNVAGNAVWFKLWDRSGWMSAKYVDNLGHVGWCGHHRSAADGEAQAEQLPANAAVPADTALPVDLTAPATATEKGALTPEPR